MDMENLGVAVEVEHLKANGRNAWHYIIPTTLMPIHLVEYEKEGLELEEVYGGTSEEKAKKAFKRAIKKLTA